MQLSLGRVFRIDKYVHIFKREKYVVFLMQSRKNIQFLNYNKCKLKIY